MQKIIFKPYRHLDIKNIIFDLGGVIINIDYHLTIDAFKKIGFKNFDSVFTQASQLGIFDQLDKGLITPDEFRTEIRKFSENSYSDKQLDDAWNAMLLDFPIERLKLLESIKQQYRTFLLSNTNQIHCDVYTKDLQNTYGVNNLSHFFKKVYLSYEIHMRKPDSEAFMLILNENDLKPEETLFIDDTMQHIEGAKKVGLITHFLNLKNGKTIDKLFAFV